jgi:hypothetical protein
MYEISQALIPKIATCYSIRCAPGSRQVPVSTVENLTMSLDGFLTYPGDWSEVGSHPVIEHRHV